MNQTDDLLSRILRVNPELHAEDAFVVPPWFWQQRSWVDDPVRSDNAIYNYPLALRIRGPLDGKILEQSLQQILQRHYVLRSVFRVMDEELVQVVVPALPASMPTIDLSGLRAWPAHEMESRARRVALHEAQQPVDLWRGPLLRTALLRLDREDHVLLLTTHHIVHDDWSTGILLRELMELYSAGTAARPSSLPALSFRYGDFARWLRDKLQTTGLQRRLEFWKRELAGGKDFHHLLTDHPRPECRTYRGSCASAVVSEDLARSLKTLSQKERVSLFMTLLAAFQCLLLDCSGDQDIAVASCAANRPLVEVEGLMGRFGNDLVLRTDLTGNPTFRELLGRVRTTSLTAFSYQDLPFGKLVEELQSDNASGRNPLFQVMFILQDAPKPNCTIPGLSLNFFPLELGTAKYDLTVWVRPHKRLEVSFEYNADLFEAETMVRILARYQRLLEAVAENPDVHTSELTTLRRAEKVVPRVRESRPDLASIDDGVQAKLVEIWENTLGHRPIGVTDNYFQLGGTSLQAARIFTRIEEEFGVKLPLSALLQAATIRELSETIRESGAADSSSCLVEIQPGGRRPAFFCVHGAGGNVLIYRDLARHLGPDQPFYGVQPEGLDGKRPLLTRVEDMATRYLEEIQCLQPKGPYCLGGYCGGGTIAFEMAQQLCAQGQKVMILALLDTYNWARIGPDSLLDDSYFYLQQTLFRFRTLLLRNPKDKLGRLYKKLNGLKNAVTMWPGILVDKVVGSRRHTNHQSFTTAQLSEINERATLSYIPKVYPGRIFQFCPIRQYARYSDPAMGWDDLAVEGVEKVVLPVYPAGMLEEPFVRDLAATLRDCIDKVMAEHERPITTGSQHVC